MHRAWLNAAPGKSKLTRFAKLQLESRKAGATPSPLLTLPELPYAVEHLIEYLFDVGPLEGDHALSSTELRNWSELTGTLLNEFQASMLLALSKAYLRMLHEAASPDCPAPYEKREQEPAEAVAEKRKQIGDTLFAFLRGQNDPKAKAAREKKQRERGPRE